MNSRDIQGPGVVTGQSARVGAGRDGMQPLSKTAWIPTTKKEVELA